jgi:hypothetical protein
MIARRYLKMLTGASIAIVGTTVLVLIGGTGTIASDATNIEPAALPQGQEAAVHPNAGRAVTNEEQGIDSVGGNCFAVVNSNGSLARGNCMVRSAKMGTGWYEVIFNGSVRNCLYSATIGSAGSVGSPPKGQIGVIGRATDVRGVWVETTTSGGSYTNLGFHLAVFCR